MTTIFFLPFLCYYENAETPLIQIMKRHPTKKKCRSYMEPHSSNSYNPHISKWEIRGSDASFKSSLHSLFKYEMMYHKPLFPFKNVRVVLLEWNNGNYELIPLAVPHSMTG